MTGPKGGRIRGSHCNDTMWSLRIELIPYLPERDHPHVFLYCAADEEPCFITGIVPPRFTPDGEPPETAVVDVQQANKLVLPCGVSGTPTPSVSWYREGSAINSMFVSPNGTLAIRVTESELSRQGALYYCIATNRIGRTNSTIAALRSRNVNVSLSCKCFINHNVRSSPT